MVRIPKTQKKTSSLWSWIFWKRLIKRRLSKSSVSRGRTCQHRGPTNRAIVRIHLRSLYLNNLDSITTHVSLMISDNAKLWLPTSHHPFLPITSQIWPYPLRVWAQVSMVEQTMHHFPLPHAGIDWQKEDHTMCCVLILCPNRYAFPSPAFSSGNFSSTYTKSSLNLWSAKI